MFSKVEEFALSGEDKDSSIIKSPSLRDSWTRERDMSVLKHIITLSYIWDIVVATFLASFNSSLVKHKTEQHFTGAALKITWNILNVYTRSKHSFGVKDLEKNEKTR